MFGTEFAKGAGNSPVFGHFSFGPNAAVDPVISGALSTLVGGAAKYVSTIAYSATGIYTVTFIADAFSTGTAHKFYLVSHADSLANSFDVVQVGNYNSTTRQLVIQAHRERTAFAPAANAATKINVLLVTNDSSAP